MSGMDSTWEALSAQAPELAGSIAARFDANEHHVIGTIREDGSVRLSGIEADITPHRVGVGMMPDSLKLDDVRRDARVELHSAPLDPKLVEGDAKLRGVLIEDGVPEGRPGTVFTLRIDNASLVKVVGDQLEFTTWSPRSGLSHHA